MADRPAAERSEKPTPERLKRAREEGQVAQSREIPSALMVAALLIVLALSASTVYQWFTHQVHQGVSLQRTGAMSEQSVAHLMRTKATESLVTLLPFLAGAAAASVGGSLLVGGWAFSPKAAKIRFDRMNPVTGLRNLFSLRSLVALLVSLAKLVVLMAIVWLYLSERMPAVLRLSWASPEGAVVVIASLVFGLGLRVAIGLAAIAGVDLLFQKWRYKRELRMTRQEVKEERREYEISPEVRGRIRAIQIQLARRRMLQEVPKADVVITNPTHVAVALSYDPHLMDAPEVVAKGGDFLCQKIKEIARAHGVPVVHRPELARTLYATVDVGQQIPQALFVAVAEVLAMIYRMRRRGGQPAASGRTDKH